METKTTFSYKFTDMNINKKYVSNTMEDTELCNKKPIIVSTPTDRTILYNNATDIITIINATRGEPCDEKTLQYIEKNAINNKNNLLLFFALGIYYLLNKNNEKADYFLDIALQNNVLFPNTVQYANHFNLWNELMEMIAFYYEEEKNYENAMRYYSILLKYLHTYPLIYCARFNIYYDNYSQRYIKSIELSYNECKKKLDDNKQLHKL